MGPVPSVGLTLTWFIWDRNLALHVTLHSLQLIAGIKSASVRMGPTSFPGFLSLWLRCRQWRQRERDPGNEVDGEEGWRIRQLASHQCGPGSNPRFGVICRLSLLVLLFGVQDGVVMRAPMWPGFDFPTRRHMWVEFVRSLLCSESFFSGYSSFSLS